jgi:hypothetical protein
MTVMKKRATPLVDEHLESLRGMQLAEAGDFFYTRLKTKMLADTEENKDQLWRFPLRPVWIVSTLVLLLGMNGFMLTQQYRSKHIGSKSTNSSLQDFAKAYDQTINTSY